MPRESLQPLGLELEEDSEVNMAVDQAGRRIILERLQSVLANIDAKFAHQLDDFIEQYRLALEELTK